MKTPLASPRIAAALVALLGSMAFAAESPPLSDKVVDAYSKYACFVLFEVSSGTPEEHRACEKEVGEAIVQAYPSMSAEERAHLEQAPAEWAILQEEWSKLNEAQRDQLRAQWALMLQSQMEGADTATGGSGPDKP